MLTLSCGLLLAAPAQAKHHADKQPAPATPPAATDSKDAGSSAAPAKAASTPAATAGAASASASPDQDANPDQSSSQSDSAEPPEPDGVKRSTPASAAEELAWVNKRISRDPFLQPNKPIGPAPEVKEFYDPLKRLAPALTPQLSSYLVQDPRGQIMGNLTVQITREVSPLFGPVYHCLLQPDFSDRKQLEVWQSAVTGKPLRVLRRSLAPAADHQPGSAAAPQVLEAETLDSTYFFDRVVVSKDGGAVTLSARKRLLPYSFDIAQLPLLMSELDIAHMDWPFEAPLYDPSTLAPVQLQVNRPERKDVLSAEPATCACWALPVRLGTTQLTWYVERAAPQRLIKFQMGTFTYTLQQYTARSGT